MKKKAKKNINILPFLVPILSVLAGSTIIVPAAILARRKHVTMLFDEQRGAGTKTGEFDYQFKLINKMTDDQTLRISSKVTFMSDASCYLEVVGDPVFAADKKSFSQHVKMHRLDGLDLVKNDRCLFDLNFTMLNADGTKAGEDVMYYISIKFTGGNDCDF